MTLSVGVIARTETYRQLEAVVTSAWLALGERVLVICEVPPNLIGERALLERQWPGLTLVETAHQLVEPRVIQTRDYWLTLPAGTIREIFGVLPALDLLKGNPKVSGVGGFQQDSSGSLSTSAFVKVAPKNSGGLTLIPHEMSNAVWAASGPFALTRTDAIGGFSLLRSDESLANVAFCGDEVAQALASFSFPKAPRYLLSSALLAVVDRRRVGSPPSSVPIALPSSAYEGWRAEGVSEVKVLDLGIGIRNDQEQAVIFYPRAGFELVDETLEGAPFDRSSFYELPENLAPLGPALVLAHSFHRGMAGHSATRPLGTSNLSAIEGQIISRIRAIKNRFPSRLNKLLEALVTSILYRGRKAHTTVR